MSCAGVAVAVGVGVAVVLAAVVVVFLTAAFTFTLTHVFFDFLFFPFTVTVILAVPVFFAFSFPFLETETTDFLLDLKETDFLALEGETLTFKVADFPLARVTVFFVTFFLPIFSVTRLTAFLLAASALTSLTKAEESTMRDAIPKATRRLVF